MDVETLVLFCWEVTPTLLVSCERVVLAVARLVVISARLMGFASLLVICFGEFFVVVELLLTRVVFNVGPLVVA